MRREKCLWSDMKSLSIRDRNLALVFYIVNSAAWVNSWFYFLPAPKPWGLSVRCRTGTLQLLFLKGHWKPAAVWYIWVVNCAEDFSCLRYQKSTLISFVGCYTIWGTTCYQSGSLLFYPGVRGWFLSVIEKTVNGKVNPCTATLGQHGRYGAGSGRVSITLHQDNCAKPPQCLWSVMLPPLCMVSWLLQGGAETSALEHILTAPVFRWADCSSPFWLHSWAYAANIKLDKPDHQLVIASDKTAHSVWKSNFDHAFVKYLQSSRMVEVAAWSLTLAWISPDLLFTAAIVGQPCRQRSV